MAADIPFGVVERLARLETQLANLTDDVKVLAEVVVGPPWERSLRSRVHQLEDDAETVKKATQAAEMARVTLEQATEAQFTRREKLTALWFAALLAVSSTMTLVIQLWVHG